MNTNPMHFSEPFAARTRFEKPLVNSAFTLALVTGLTVPDTSENAAANLAWTDIKLPKPVFEGDTLWAESEILEVRESASNPNVGIVSMRCRGVNQRSEVVIEFKRTFMVYRAAPRRSPTLPGTTDDMDGVTTGSSGFRQTREEQYVACRQGDRTMELDDHDRRHTARTSGRTRSSMCSTHSAAGSPPTRGTRPRAGPRWASWAGSRRP